MSGTCCFIFLDGSGFTAFTWYGLVFASSASFSAFSALTPSKTAFSFSRRDAICAIRSYPPGFSSVVATVTGQIPASTMPFILWKSAPPE